MRKSRFSRVDAYVACTGKQNTQKKFKKNKKPRIGGAASSSSSSSVAASEPPASASPASALPPTRSTLLRPDRRRHPSPPPDLGRGAERIPCGGRTDGRRICAGTTTVRWIPRLHRRRMELRLPCANADRRRATVTEARTRRVMREKRGVRERER
ncbi:hypothetical protein [Oryza sativa Japonica Group]|uniref:Uncharacterized protein n=1 Tax=Oryza sativa subsp. japonica TaxID=39947 RepID=Q5QM50_ORYSJ|nr:hypothetical protein [Oryza sativa Japonica Group]